MKKTLLKKNRAAPRGMGLVGYKRRLASEKHPTIAQRMERISSMTDHIIYPEYTDGEHLRDVFVAIAEFPGSPADFANWRREGGWVRCKATTDPIVTIILSTGHFDDDVAASKAREIKVALKKGLSVEEFANLQNIPDRTDGPGMGRRSPK